MVDNLVLEPHMQMVVEEVPVKMVIMLQTLIMVDLVETERRV
jgi:hypothetical protein